MAQATKEKKLPKGISKRSDGRYMARFMVDGKRVSLYGHDPKLLEKQMQSMIYEAEHGIYIKEKNITVEGWFQTWMQEYKFNSVKYGTYKCYEQTFDLYIRAEIGKRKITEIRPEHIQSIYNKLIKESYSASTIRLVAVVLSGMFGQAYKNQILKSNPVGLAIVPRNKKIKKEIRVMTKDEQNIFLKYAKESPYYNLYVVGLGTGMRSGELRALEWSDVDFKNKEIHVTGTLKYHNGEGYTKDTPKTESSARTIPMLDKVYNTLKLQRKQQAELRMSLGNLWAPEKGLENLVFTSPYPRKAYGIPISHAALNNDMKKVVKRINEEGIAFKDITPHTLRHTFATRGLENGIPPKVMQELLGHTSITMTLDIYSHVLPDTKAEEIQKLSDLV